MVDYILLTCSLKTAITYYKYSRIVHVTTCIKHFFIKQPLKILPQSFPYKIKCIYLNRCTNLKKIRNFFYLTFAIAMHKVCRNKNTPIFKKNAELGKKCIFYLRVCQFSSVALYKKHLHTSWLQHGSCLLKA